MKPGDIRMFHSTDETDRYGVSGCTFLVLKARQVGDWVDLISDGNIIEGFGYTWVLERSEDIHETR